MANENNGKQGVVQKTIYMPQRLVDAIQRCLESEIAAGKLPSEADIIRDAIVAGLIQRGFDPRQP